MNARPLALALALLLASPSWAGPLGGGYQKAKWGMTPAQAQEALAAGGFGLESKAASFADGGSVLKLGKGREHLRCEFFKGAFYRAVLRPGLGDGDKDGADEILKVLGEKYGKGSPIEGYADDAGQPLRIVGWDDGESTIELWMTDPAPPGHPALGIYPSSTLRIIYASKELSRQKDAAEQSLKVRRAQDERKTREDALKGDL